MILINKVDNFKEINKQLLYLINKIPSNPLIENNDNILHTDYNLPNNFKREYLDYFFKIIKPYIEKMAVNLKSKEIKISHIWFQQYEKNNTHGWHTHPKAHFTNIYFVELPSNSLTTEILGHDKLNLNEGDLLTFPAYFYHRSPINLTNERKTIISFNSDISCYNE
jgi:hypothetical protein